MQINILEAKNRLSRLIKSVQSGEEVIIANRGEPVAKLVAVVPRVPAETQTGSAGALLDWLQSNPLPPERRRSHDAIEATLREERGAWD
jgi:prevent-host-death family protein